MSGRWRVERRGATARGAAVARVARQGAGGRPLERAGARAGERGRCAAAGPGRARGRVRRPPRRRADAAPRRPLARRGAAASSGSWRGSGTCGWPRRSGRSASRRGCASATSATRRCGGDVGGPAADAGVARLSAAAGERLSPRRPAVPPLRHDRARPRPGRREPDCVLVPRLPGRRRATRRVSGVVAVRAPHLHLTLRGFCLGAFVFLGRALEEGDELPFAFEEHLQRSGPALYEYRPLVRTFIESRASALAGREDALLALDELLREPAAAIYARAHADPGRRRSRRSSAPCWSRS